MPCSFMLLVHTQEKSDRRVTRSGMSGLNFMVWFRIRG
jgi:hypothetical protein